MTDLFQHQYRISTARASWHAYDGGLYFVTICTADMVHSFGEIRDNEMLLSVVGQCAEEVISTVQIHHPYAEIPLHVVMPNHIHLVVYIDQTDIPSCRDGACTVSLTHDHEFRDGACTVSTEKNDRWKNDVVDEQMQTISKRKGKLSVVIGSLKSAITRLSNQTAIPFSWQTRFHEHIIRNQEECNQIAQYIQNNVAQWDADQFCKNSQSPL